LITRLPPLVHARLPVPLGRGRIARVPLQHFDPDAGRGVLPQAGRAHPGLDDGTAPARIDKSDRHAFIVLDLAPEEKAGRGEIIDRAWAGHEPVHRLCELRHGLHAAVPLNVQQPDPAVARRADFGFQVRHAPDLHFHVRLAGTQPDFADHHIIKCDRV